MVHVNNTKRLVTPEEVGQHILLELLGAAERNLSARVGKAVMSVPAEFDDMQRNYTKKAGLLAGLTLIIDMLKS